jgi:hypothetical protein
MAFAAYVAPVYGWDEPVLCTNKIAIANGKEIFLAMCSTNTQSKTNIQAVIGSQVVFMGIGAESPGTNLFLTVQSNIVLVVEFNPPYLIANGWPMTVQVVKPLDTFYFHSKVEALGTLKSVDLEKRAIKIVAKQEDVKNTDPLF